jgi:hypothetical protein
MALDRKHWATEAAQKLTGANGGGVRPSAVRLQMVEQLRCPAPRSSVWLGNISEWAQRDRRQVAKEDEI